MKNRIYIKPGELVTRHIVLVFFDLCELSSIVIAATIFDMVIISEKRLFF